MFARLLATATLLVLVTGCATSTAPGAVGVERPQLLMVSSTVINNQAATAFSKMSATAANEGKLNTDAAMTSRVRDIAGRLIAQVKVYRPEAASWNWQVNVIDSEQLNAFCMPGGKIAVYSGLIKRLDLSDAELAAVMGHEIAHALREHSREKVSQQALSNAAVQAIASTNSRYAGVHASLAQVGSLLFLQLPFSREMELEADIMGLELMARAGYDPRLASNVWRKMQKEGGSGRVEFFATHPNHENRIAALDSTVPKVEPLYARVSGARTGTPSVPVVASTQQIQEVAPPGTRSQVVVTPPTASALTSSATAPVPGRVGPDSYQIEKMGLKKQCDPNARAWLAAKETGFELYTYQCNGAETWSLRCEFGQCRVLQ